MHLAANRTGGRAGTEAAGEVDQPKPRRKLVFGIVALALFMAAIDQTIVATALSTLQRDLHAPINWSSWTITTYALGQILTMPLAGRISDIYGRKRVFHYAVALFTVASLCCGFAPSIYVLVPLRGLQAIGGGAFLPSANGIVSDMFGRERDRALGMFTSIFPIGAVAGPTLGGVFVSYWTWRGIFLVNVPLGIILVVLGLRFIPSERMLKSQRLDVRGVALLGGTLLPIMYGITSLGEGNRTVADPSVGLPIVLGLAFGGLFLRNAARSAHSFIPARLLYGPGFGIMNVINFLLGCSAFGFSVLVPLYAQDRYGISTLSGGTLLVARAVGMICVAGAAVMALRKTGCRPPMVLGTTIVAIGMVGMAVPPHLGLSPYWWLSVAAAFTGIGLGMAFPATNNAILQYVRDDIAAVAGLRGMFRQAGGIMAVSITTAILARSADPSGQLAHIFLVFTGLLLISLPMMFRVPNYRGRI